MNPNFDPELPAAYLALDDQVIRPADGSGSLDTGYTIGSRFQLDF